MKSYSELIKLPTFEERVRYLQTNSEIGTDTFGGNRYLNQALYQSREWRDTRRKVILRDEGCDLACPDRPLHRKIYIHHINPITVEDAINRSASLFDLDNLICVSFETHQAIHYSNESILTSSTPTERRPNDTSPWR